MPITGTAKIVGQAFGNQLIIALDTFSSVDTFLRRIEELSKQGVEIEVTIKFLDPSDKVQVPTQLHFSIN